jgi:hypothetical protein
VTLQKYATETSNKHAAGLRNRCALCEPLIRGVSEMKRSDPAEHERAEAEYVMDCCDEFLTDDERLARLIRFFELKSPVDDNDPGSKEHREERMAAIEERHSQADIARARAIVNRGMRELSMARKRVLREAPQLIVRCSKCGGVLRTPRARQCRWCGHDWHLYVI